MLSVGCDIQLPGRRLHSDREYHVRTHMEAVSNLHSLQESRNMLVKSHPDHNGVFVHFLHNDNVSYLDYCGPP